MNCLKGRIREKRIGVSLEAALLISIGELSVWKNHRVVAEALQKRPNNYWYIIVGQGD